MRAHHFATLLAGGVLLLAGCGESAPAPKPLETPTVAATPTVAPAPEMPDAAKKPGPKGAEAFVRHYVDLINYAQKTGDVEALSDAESPQCTSCDSPRGAIEELYLDGGSLDGGDLRITRSQVLANHETGGYLDDLVLQFGPQIVRHGDGTQQRLKGGQIFLAVQILRNKAGLWKVIDSTRSQ